MSNHSFGRWKALFVFAVVVTIIPNVAQAGGSWGSSRGSLIGGGLLGGRQPVRNLLSGVGYGVGAIGQGIGTLGYRFADFVDQGRAFGGSNGFGSSGSLGLGSNGGFLNNGGLLGLGIGPRVRSALGSTGLSSLGSRFGSTGGWGAGSGFGSSGGSTGSRIVPSFAPPSPVFTSPVVSLPSVGYSCTGSLYAGISTDYYSELGGSYLHGSVLNAVPVVSELSHAIPIDSFEVLPFNQTGLEYDSIESAFAAGVSHGDPGLVGQPLSVETDYSAPTLDYGAVSTGNPSAGVSVVPTFDDQMIGTPSPGTTFGPVDNNSGNAIGAESGFGEGLPEAPSPDGEDENINSTRRSTSKNNRLELASSSRSVARPVLTRAGQGEAVLGLAVPIDAQVYINGKLTKTSGALREYVSRNLKEGKSYSYQVKVIVRRDGEKQVRSRLIRVATGVSSLVKFDFTRPQVTKLILHVPSDAQVLLDNRATKATGNRRVFSTTELTNEQAWEDYQIEVRYNDGERSVVQTKRLNLVAGSTQVIRFTDSHSDKIADSDLNDYLDDHLAVK